MDELGHDQNAREGDWERVDSRILGQILAAQNFLFVLPDETRIAEFFSRALSSMPGVGSILVCLGNMQNPSGSTAAPCDACLALWGEKGGVPVMPGGFLCKLSAMQDLQVIKMGTYDHTFGFFVIRTDLSDLFEPYLPFIYNLANHIALSLENRMQKLLLEKSRDELEEKIAKRTADLMDMNTKLEDEIRVRITAEKALSNEKDRFRRLAENARDVIYRMLLPEGKYEYVSPAATDIFGYNPEEIYRSPKLIRTIIHPDWQGYVEEQWSKMLQGDIPPTYEYPFIHKSGEVRWVNQRNILICDEKGSPIALEGIVTDITDRKHFEEELNRLNKDLEQRVKERTAELEQKNLELEQMNRIFVGRELRMIELKEKIAELEGLKKKEITES